MSSSEERPRLSGRYDPRPTASRAATVTVLGRVDALTIHTMLQHEDAGSFLDGPAHGSQMIAETQGRRPLALGKVAVELQLPAQGDACPDPFGLASLGVADRLRNPEEVHSGRLAQRGHHRHRPGPRLPDPPPTLRP
jgi:hypothetical protein